MKLILIRHGETEANRKRVYYGSTDVPILPESADELKKLAESGIYPKVERYYTSGMRRAEQSFSALFGDTPHEVLPGMRELNFGDFEMRPYEELKNDPAFREWIKGDIEKNVCPNGESGEMVTARALAALEPVIRDGRDALIVTHGGVIGGVMNSFFPNENGRYLYTPDPGRGYILSFDGMNPVSYTELK